MSMLQEVQADDGSTPGWQGGYTTAAMTQLKSHSFDRRALGARGLNYERLDQLTMELLLGVR
jgi:xylose isomerase